MLAQEQLAEILSALPDPAFILTRSGRYAGVFGGTDARYYHDGSGLVGKSIADVLNPEKARWFLAEIDKALSSRQLHIVEYGLAGSDVQGVPAGGPQHTLHFEGRVQALRLPVDGEDAVLWIASNITARHQLEQQLRTLSETDPLTGLRNRRSFARVVVTERERALRYDHPVSLLMFDIDLFKVINDTYGHGAGDAVLVELARAVLACTRESDTLTRWGGEEFALLMPYATLATASEAAEKIRHAVEAHRFAQGLRVTISIGVGEWQIAEESIDMLLSRVDEVLYQAKHEGRNRIVRSSAAPVLAGALPATGQLPRLIWRSRYATGDDEIDRQHKRLFDVARQLAALPPKLAAPDDAGRIAALTQVDRFLSEVQDHFAFEEGKLAALDWSGLAKHRAEHQRLLACAFDQRRRLADDATPERALQLIGCLMVDLVTNHMLRSDRDYVALLRERRRQD